MNKFQMAAELAKADGIDLFELEISEENNELVGKYLAMATKLDLCKEAHQS